VDVRITTNFIVNPAGVASGGPWNLVHRPAHDHFTDRTTRRIDFWAKW
jgi:hypothetical protein